MKITLDLNDYQKDILVQLITNELNTCESHKKDLNQALGVHIDYLEDILRQIE